MPPGFPARAIQFCLDQAGAKITEVDHVAVPRDPWARLGTKLRYAVRMPAFAADRVSRDEAASGVVFAKTSPTHSNLIPRKSELNFTASSITVHTSQAHFLSRHSIGRQCSPQTDWVTSQASCAALAKDREYARWAR